MPNIWKGLIMNEQAAIMGSGRACSEHIKAYQAAGVDVVAVCSRTIAGALKKIRECKINQIAKAYTDVYVMLKQQPDIKFVSVCSPPEYHVEHTIAAAEAGKHIAIEKPVALNKHGLMRMRNVVRDSGVRTVVGFVLRWNDLMQNIKVDYIHKLGELRHIETGYWHGSSHTKKVKKHEYGTRNVEIGAFIGGGCHAVDMARYMLGSNIAAVSAYNAGGRFGPGRSTFARVRFENGLYGNISAMDDIFMPYWFQMQLFGQDGVIRDTNQIYSKSTGEDWLTIPGTVPDSGDVWHHPFEPMIKELVDCAQSDEESACPLENSVNTHLACFAVEESARRNGETISIL